MDREKPFLRSTGEEPTVNDMSDVPVPDLQLGQKALIEVEVIQLYPNDHTCFIRFMDGQSVHTSQKNVIPAAAPEPHADAPADDKPAETAPAPEQAAAPITSAKKAK